MECTAFEVHIVADTVVPHLPEPVIEFLFAVRIKRQDCADITKIIAVCQLLFDVESGFQRGNNIVIIRSNIVRVLLLNPFVFQLELQSALDGFRAFLMDPEVNVDIFHVSKQHLQPSSVGLNRIGARRQIGIGNVLSVYDHIVGAQPGFDLIRRKIVRDGDPIDVDILAKLLSVIEPDCFFSVLPRQRVRLCFADCRVKSAQRILFFFR